MKKLKLIAIYILLALPITSCSNEDENSRNPATSEMVTDTTSSKEKESEKDMIRDSIEFGLTINNKYYPIPIALKQLINDEWSISKQAPYFMNPMVSEDYYEMRANLSLSKDGEAILPGGSIIRLLEKDGVLLEVTIANQVGTENDEKYRKVEDGVIDSILVFYDKTRANIKLNDKEVRSLTPEILLVDYPVSDGWTHTLTNYRDYPEFGISKEHIISKNLDNCNRNITVYFDLENIAFKISVVNQTSLNFYSK